MCVWRVGVCVYSDAHTTRTVFSRLLWSRPCHRLLRTMTFHQQLHLSCLHTVQLASACVCAHECAFTRNTYTRTCHTCMCACTKYIVRITHPSQHVLYDLYGVCKHKCVANILCAHLLSTISSTCMIYMICLETNVSPRSYVLIYYLLFPALV